MATTVDRNGLPPGEGGFEPGGGGKADLYEISADALASILTANGHPDLAQRLLRGEAFLTELTITDPETYEQDFSVADTVIDALKANARRVGQFEWVMDTRGGTFGTEEFENVEVVVDFDDVEWTIDNEI